MQPPRVTVLMTVYNGRAFLPEAIESVLRQTLREFELLIIDDASTDGSVARIRSYHDPRIRLVVNEANVGQTPSLNRGLALARAPYVARLDQDDVCLPDRLERQASLLQQHPETAVVGTRMMDMDEHGRRLGAAGRQMKDRGTFLGLLCLGLCPLGHPSVMFRREMVLSLGGYDASCAPAEDVDLWTKLAMHGHTAQVIDEPLVLRRVHGGQQSVTKAALQQQQVHRAQDRLIASCAPPAHVRGVTLLLRRDGALWGEYGTPERLSQIVDALFATFTNAQERYQLTPEERVGFMRVMRRWFGPGLVPVRWMLRWPPALFLPLACLCLPAQVPPVRAGLSRLMDRFRRLKRTAVRRAAPSPRES